MAKTKHELAMEISNTLAGLDPMRYSVDAGNLLSRLTKVDLIGLGNFVRDANRLMKKQRKKESRNCPVCELALEKITPKDEGRYACMNPECPVIEVHYSRFGVMDSIKVDSTMTNSGNRYGAKLAKALITLELSM